MELCQRKQINLLFTVRKCRGSWGNVCWVVGKIKGNDERSVGAMGKVWQSVLGVGEAWGEVWGV